MQLFALGSNAHGQLGVGHSNDLSLPESCPGVSVAECQITPLAFAANTSWLLGPSNDVRATGQPIPNSSSQASLSAQVFESSSCFEDIGKVKLIAATWEALILVTFHNHIYVCGNGPKGELGYADRLATGHEILKLKDFPPRGAEVLCLSTSPNHVIVVLSTGEVYGWGNGRKGELGLPAMVVTSPRKISNLPHKIGFATCGKDFTCLLEDNTSGRVVVLGSDRWGVKSSLPSSLGSIRSIGASWNSILVLTSSGRVESYGRNDKGQHAPFNLPLLSTMAVGSEHAIAITLDGQIISWGWGEHGNCGGAVDKNGNVHGRWNIIPLLIDQHILKPEAVAAGYATSFIWAEVV